MKIRTGFVSNSSSSSFVISVGEKIKSPKVLIEVDLTQFCNSAIKTEEELNDYFLEKFDWEHNSSIEGFLKSNPFMKKEYDTALKEIHAGKRIYFGKVADFGEGGDAQESALRDALQHGDWKLNSGSKLLGDWAS